MPWRVRAVFTLFRPGLCPLGQGLRLLVFPQAAAIPCASKPPGQRLLALQPSLGRVQHFCKRGPQHSIVRQENQINGGTLEIGLLAQVKMVEKVQGGAPPPWQGLGSHHNQQNLLPSQAPSPKCHFL